LEADPQDGADIEYYYSADGGSNWQEITSQWETQLDHPGNESYWYGIINTNLENASFINEVEVQGLDTLPKNFSVDIGDNGTTDYIKEGRVGDLEKISLPTQPINEFSGNVEEGLMVVPLNFSFIGKGEVTVQSIEVSYTTNDIELLSGTVNAFVNNVLTAIEYVTSLVSGDSIKTNTETNISLENNVIVENTEIEIGGDSYK